MVPVTLNVYTNVYTNFGVGRSLLLTFAGLRESDEVRSLA